MFTRAPASDARPLEQRQLPDANRFPRSAAPTESRADAVTSFLLSTRLTAYIHDEEREGSVMKSA